MPLSGRLTQIVFCVCPVAWMSAISSAYGAPLQPRQLPREIYLDRSGLPELVVQSAVSSMVLGTLVTQTVFRSNDRNRAVSGTVLGLGAGVVLPIVLTHDKPVHGSQAAWYGLGQRWGLANGILLPFVWKPSQSWHWAVSSAVLGGGGLLLSLHSYDRLQPTPGQASAVSAAYTFGAIGTGLLMTAMDVMHDRGAGFALPVLLFSNAAAGAALHLRRWLDIDRRRVVLTEIGGFFGMAVGLGTGLLVTGVDSWDGRTQFLASAMLGGMVAGLGFGFWFSRSLDTFHQSSSEVYPRSHGRAKTSLQWPRLRWLCISKPRTGRPMLVLGIDLVRGVW